MKIVSVAEGDPPSGTRRGIAALARPSSVAIIGASTDLAKYPGKIVSNLRRFNFQGPVYAVNPKYKEVLGYPCFADISELPGPVDVALILIGAKGVPAALESVAAAGCGAAIVFASGMAEASADGKALQRELEAVVERTGLRVLGPNCMGLVNVIDRTVFCGAAALMSDSLQIRPGAIGIVAQSGGVMGSVLDRGWAAGVDFSYGFSTGNEGDVTLADCVDFLVADESTRAISLFIESVRNPDHFRAACERAAEAGKTIVALKVGRSEAGKRAASTHTASMAGDDAAIDALFGRLGIVRVSDLDELYSIPGLVVNSPSPKGNRVAIACSSGGLAGLSADKCAEHGLQLAQFSKETTAEIAAMQAGFGFANNPLDITGQVVSKESWWMTRRMEELLLADDAVDVLVVAQPTSQNADASADQIVSLAAASEKPVVALWTGTHAIAAALAKLRAARVPVFEQADLCYRSIAGVLAAREFRARRAALGSAAAPTIDAARQREARRMLSGGADSLSEHESTRLVALYGVRVPRAAVVRTAREAADSAAAIGYPVAVKAHGRTVSHKTELNAVRLGLSDAQGVTAAFADVTRGAKVQEAIVAGMAPSGVEIMVGLVRDPQVGMLLLVGAGGIAAEALADTVIHAAPLWPGEALEMLSELRVARQMRGFRGRPPLDIDSAVKAIEAISQLALEAGDHIEQLDLNPLIVGPMGSGAWAVDSLVVPLSAGGPSETQAVPR